MERRIVGDLRSDCICPICHVDFICPPLIEAHWNASKSSLQPCGAIPFLQTNERIYTAVVDTETTGLSKTRRLVELGVVCFDDNGKNIDSWSVIIKPDNFEIPIDATNIHHITTKFALTNGVSIQSAFDQCNQILRRVKLIVGHNLPFDLHTLAIEICHLQFGHPIADQLCYIPRYDTHEMSKRILGRSAKLDELYTILTKNPPTNMHRVIDDILMTKKVYDQLLKRETEDVPYVPFVISIPDPSSEQKIALDQFKSGHNIIIDSVAGGGKTTFIIHLAKTYPDRNILFLTFNRRLHDETQERASVCNITNLHIYTYHGFCARHYRTECKSDSSLARLIRKDLQLNYNTIVVDEAQDIMPLYFKLIRKIILSSVSNSQLCFIGDRYQTIYSFKGADARFLIMSESLHEKPFVQCEFHQTFRCSRPIAAFVNSLINHERLISNKDGPPVKYVVANIFGDDQIPNLIISQIGKYGIENVFILVPSTRAKPFATIINSLSQKGIDVYVPNSDFESPRSDAMRNKLPILSYHQSKGLERNCVICMSFDSGYFKMYNTNCLPHQLCNEQYVALTRAKEELFVVQHYATSPLMFVTNAMEQCQKIILQKQQLSSNTQKSIVYSVCNLVRYKSMETINQIFQIIKPTCIREPQSDKIEIPTITKGRNGCIEEISDITGVALPMAFGIRNGILLENRINELADIDRYFFDKMMRIYPQIEINPETLTEIMQTAALWNAFQSKYEHKLKQIQDWNWISQENFDIAFSRMRNELGVIGKQEVVEKIHIDANAIIGVIDWEIKSACNVETYYEIKCVSSLKDEHFLQLALYALLVFDPNKKQQFKLFNVMTNEVAMIHADSKDDLLKVYDLIMNDSSTNNRSDPEFVEYAKHLH